MTEYLHCKDCINCVSIAKTFVMCYKDYGMLGKIRKIYKSTLSGNGSDSLYCERYRKAMKRERRTRYYYQIDELPKGI